MRHHTVIHPQSLPGCRGKPGICMGNGIADKMDIRLCFPFQKGTVSLCAAQIHPAGTHKNRLQPMFSCLQAEPEAVLPHLRLHGHIVRKPLRRAIQTGMDAKLRSLKGNGSHCDSFIGY